jgi:hypothetical protein
VGESKIKSSTCIFISYYFPPIKSVGVIRNFHLAQIFHKIFTDLYILTTSNQQILPKEEADLSSFKSIELINTIDYRTIIQRFYTKNKNTHYPESIKQNKLIQWLIKANESLPFNLFVGEGGLLYLIDGYSKAKKIIKRTNTKTFVITSFRPTANVLIGFLLKVNYPHIIWINSFQDAPYDRIRKNTIIPNLQNYLWLKMLKQSNLNITTSQGVKNSIDLLNNDTITFENGVDFRENLTHSSEQFTISYTGSLYHDLRDPSLLFEALTHLVFSEKIQVNKLKIIYMGKDIAKWKSFCDTYPLLFNAFYIENITERNHSLEIQQKSHINLMLTWSESSQGGTIPAKLYEYIGAGNYIISLVKGIENSDLSHLLTTLQIGSVYQYGKTEDLEKLKNELLQLYTLWINGVYEPPNIPSHLKDTLSWDNKQSELSKLLDDLL